MKFNINGREYESYQLSTSQVRDLLRSETTTPEEKEYLTKMVIDSYNYNLCPMAGENYDDVFVRFFTNFVNGKMNSKEHVAKKMAHDHRYLQNEMFKVCLAYINELSKAYEEGYYDGRNEYACETSNKIMNNIKAINWPYWSETMEAKDIKTILTIFNNLVDEGYGWKDGISNEEYEGILFEETALRYNQK